MKILGLDPGGTTGVSIVTLNQRTGKYRLSSFDQIDGYCLLKRADENPNVTDFIAWLDKTNPDLIVMEDFVGAGKRDYNINQTLKLVGFLFGVFRTLGYPTKLQSPATRVPYKGEATKLIKVKPTANRHAIDATSHILAYVHREIRRSEDAKK